MAEIVLKSVNKTFPPRRRGEVGFHAVKNLDLTAGEGELLVLLGPSGCGKSTTLRMIAGLEELSSGTISIGGRVVASERESVHPKDRDIAMVFQNYALYPHMTVEQNMAFALKMRRVPKEQIRKRVRAVAEMLVLTDLLERKPAALSGGQRQRVAVGRAIVREPKAFLFDEPLSNLDAKLRLSTRAEIKALHQRLHTTTVYVTHDQEEAMTLGDRIAIMAGGELQQHGSPMELYRKPVNRFVAGFLGTPPMNFVEGKVEVGGSAPVFVEDGGGGGGAPWRVPLSGELASAVRGMDGQPVVLGVRPQAIVLGGEGGLPLTIGVVEPLGDQMDVVCRTPAGTPITARIAAREVQPSTTVSVSVDPARVHVFAPGEFGRNIVHSEPPR